MFRTQIFLSETNSTMEFARIICKFLSPPFVVISETQTGGHGQYGRKWESPIGGLWLTEVLNIRKRIAFSLFLSLPVLRVLNSLEIKDVFVKWPNDIYLGNKKLGGILTLVSGGTVFAGIGINIENDIPSSIEKIATTLKGKIKINKIDFLNLFLSLESAMLNDYIRFGFASFVKEYEKNLIFLHKPVKVRSRQEITGIAEGVDSFGNLILRTKNGVLKVESGTVIDFFSKNY